MASLSPRSGARTIAYFSMEIGLDASMPTYGGGLGVLAGDTLRTGADIGLPMVAVTLLHREGYFRQRLDDHGRQTETAATWRPEDILSPLGERVSVRIEGRDVQVRAWRYVVSGVTGHRVPVILLDTALPDNEPRHAALTSALYGGDAKYRLCQEAILGIGGVTMLQAMGYDNIATYHMNEGHASLLALALLEEQVRDNPRESVIDSDVDAVRQKCVFTTHTPVSAGHDKFPLSMAQEVLGAERAGLLARLIPDGDGMINLTSVAMFSSRSTNAVSIGHGKVSREMFPGQPISAITNGVHAATWTSPPFQKLYNRHFPEWRMNNDLLREAEGIPLEEIGVAHAEAKLELIAEVKRRSGHSFDPDALTIGFARRAAAYKRADLLFADVERLRQIVSAGCPLQVIYGGKAHARDTAGKGLIERIFAAAAELAGEIRVVYLEDYDISLAKVLLAGVDLWLNTPLKPMEASGTSGMKAALNAVPSLSILDGWWLEGCVEGVTGWAIGDESEEPDDPRDDAAALYGKLEGVILPLFYEQPDAYAAVMRSAIARNGSYFNTQRMMTQYMSEVYEPGLTGAREEGARATP